MTKLTKEFFARYAGIVAEDLLGKELVCKHKNGKQYVAKLTEVGAYEGEVVSMAKNIFPQPGIITFSAKHGHLLLDISTQLPSHGPACVTLRGGIVSIDDVVKNISGPGAFTKALGIDMENRRYFADAPVTGNTIWIREAKSEGRVQYSKGNAPNCAGIYKLV